MSSKCPTYWIPERSLHVNECKEKKFCKSKIIALKHKTYRAIRNLGAIFRFCLDEENLGADSLEIYRSEKWVYKNQVDKGKINHELHIACRVCGRSLLLCWVWWEKHPQKSQTEPQNHLNLFLSPNRCEMQLSWKLQFWLASELSFTEW